MIAELLDLLSIWRNPVFQRYRRSRLRVRKSIFWILATLIVATFAVSMNYIVARNFGSSPVDAARSEWLPLLIIQGLILMIKGTGSASAGLIQDKIDQTLDYQRVTPMTPLKNLVGYLFGLPVLEYAMFALTLPHLLFIVVVGALPLTTVSSVYLSFFVCVILYHMMGIAAGMVMRKWIWGYLLAIFLVVLVNVILPTFISLLGLRFFQYLSVWPVIGQKLLPVVFSAEALALEVGSNPFLSLSDAVYFFEWTLTPFVFTLMLQSTLILTFMIMALRRWTSSTRHSLGKPYALAFLSVFIILFLGNLWPAITGQFLPFTLFGANDIDRMSEVVAVGLPLVYCSIVWLLCLVLFSIVVPGHHAYVRGLRRAFKLGREAAQPWDDDSSSLSFMSVFIVVALAGLLMLLFEMTASGFFDDFAGRGSGFWRLIAAFGLVLIYTLLFLQVFELKPTVLSILLVWLLPVLVATVISAAMQDVALPQAVIASISPMALIYMTGLFPLRGVVPTGADDEFAVVLTGIYTGFTFITIQIAWLLARWRKLKGAYYALCRSWTSA